VLDHAIPQLVIIQTQLPVKADTREFRFHPKCWTGILPAYFGDPLVWENLAPMSDKFSQ